MNDEQQLLGLVDFDEAARVGGSVTTLAEVGEEVGRRLIDETGRRQPDVRLEGHHGLFGGEAVLAIGAVVPEPELQQPGLDDRRAITAVTTDGRHRLVGCSGRRPAGGMGANRQPSPTHHIFPQGRRFHRALQ